MTKNNKQNNQPINMNPYEGIKNEITTVIKEMGVKNTSNEKKIFLLEGPDDDVFRDKTTGIDRPKPVFKQPKTDTQIDTPKPWQNADLETDPALEQAYKQGVQKGYVGYHTVVSRIFVELKNNRGSTTEILDKFVDKLHMQLSQNPNQEVPDVFSHSQVGEHFNKEALRKIVFQIASGIIELVVKQAQEEAKKSNVFQYGLDENKKGK